MDKSSHPNKNESNWSPTDVLDLINQYYKPVTKDPRASQARNQKFPGNNQISKTPIIEDYWNTLKNSLNPFNLLYPELPNKSAAMVEKKVPCCVACKNNIVKLQRYAIMNTEVEMYTNALCELNMFIYLYIKLLDKVLYSMEDFKIDIEFKQRAVLTDFELKLFKNQSGRNPVNCFVDLVGNNNSGLQEETDEEELNEDELDEDELDKDELDEDELDKDKISERQNRRKNNDKINVIQPYSVALKVTEIKKEITTLKYIPATIPQQPIIGEEKKKTTELFRSLKLKIPVYRLTDYCVISFDNHIKTVVIIDVKEKNSYTTTEESRNPRINPKKIFDSGF